MKFKQKMKQLWQKKPSISLDFLKADEEEAGSINSVTEYKERIRRQKKKTIYRAGVITAGVLLAVVVGKTTADRWTYGSYKVVTETVREDTLSARYIEFGENILRYGSEEVTLVSRQGGAVWNEPHTMDNPRADVCQEYSVIYDKNGSSMAIFNLSGKVGEIQTHLPILKARVAKQGVVAAILEDGETTWLNVYGVDGQEIVTAKTRVDSPGYPVDLSISEDGLLMAVSYLRVQDNKPASYVAFYNFGNTGQNQMDNMVSGYTYTDILVPQVKYLSDSRAVAFRDDGFVIFQGKQIPEEKKTVKVKDEILGTFCDGETIGLVFREKEGEYLYRMEVYNTNGRLKWSAGTDVAFDHIAISKDQIILYNGSEFAIYSMKGTCRYQGALKEGTIQNIFKVAQNRYVVVTDSGTETIKLS